jgi:D-alanyl-D-alanine carboxypeptidase
LETAILAPHGNEGITFPNGWRVVPGMVPGHSISEGGHVTRAFPAMFHIAHGAGGLVGDVRSLMKWNLALHRGDILPPAILARMITPEGSATLPGPDGTPPDYGLGVASSTNHGEPVISHGGSIQGFATLLAWVPSTQTTVAVLANTDDPAVMSDMIARQLVAFTIGKPYLPPMTVPTPPAALAPWQVPTALVTSRWPCTSLTMACKLTALPCRRQSSRVDAHRHTGTVASGATGGHHRLDSRDSAW